MGEASPAPLVLSSATLAPLTTPARDGYLDRLYAEWFARAGLRVELVAVPATRGLENANAGLYDGDAARIDMDSSRYPNLHRIPEPLFEVAFSGLYLDRIISVQTPADFENYHVGYVRGWQIAERIFAGSKTALAVRDADSLIDMLTAKRLDIAFLTIAPARFKAREKNVQPLLSTEFRIRKNLYLHLNSSHQDKISLLTETLRVMKSDGSYDAIMAGYIAENL